MLVKRELEGLENFFGLVTFSNSLPKRQAIIFIFFSSTKSYSNQYKTSFKTHLQPPGSNFRPCYFFHTAVSSFSIHIYVTQTTVHLTCSSTIHGCHSAPPVCVRIIPLHTLKWCCTIITSNSIQITPHASNTYTPSWHQHRCNCTPAVALRIISEKKKITVVHIINSWSWLLLREQTLHLPKKLVNFCKLYLTKKNCCKEVHLEKIPLYSKRTLEKTSIKLHTLVLWVTIWT